MYHGEVMSGPVLTVKRNEPVTQNKCEATLRPKKGTKRQEMTKHYLFLECCGINKKILENVTTWQWI